MTIRDRLKGAAAALRQAGVPDPEYDSAALLSHVTGQAPLALRLETEKELTEAQEDVFQLLLARRVEREPLQYILGTAVFGGLEFDVGPGALIPRPETEMIPLWAEEKLRGRPEAEILDLCCGSGCLGLTMKHRMPQARVTLTDLSPQAVELSARNREKLGLACEILQGDLFAPVGERRFDCILSNPPYIPSKDCETLQAEVRREPRMALDGGADGLDFYRRIAAEAPAHLKPGGILIMEMGIYEAEEISRMLRDRGAGRVEVRKDEAGIDRVILAEYEG